MHIMWSRTGIVQAAALAAMVACPALDGSTRADALRQAADTLPQAADNIVDYRISVTLDADNKQLQGREHVTWRNPSSDAVPDLWFHLYLNAFQNTTTTFMRESGGQVRGATLATGGWGWTHVASLRLADGTDLLPGLHFQSPDDGNVDDRTVASVRLPSAVKPG